VDGGYEFCKGKHSGKKVNLNDPEHRSYINWVSGLSDITRSEQRFIKELLNDLPF
jgi:hypothetical protein